MITAAQKAYIEEHAYIPEHIIHYVTAVSEVEPFVLKDFIAYSGRGRLIFVGYPLKGPFKEKKMEKTLEDAIKRFKPKEVALIAPSILLSIAGGHPLSTDHYYRLDLSTLSISQKLRNMIKRSGRDLILERAKIFGGEHRQMVEEFLNSHTVDEATQSIFKKIPDYISSAPRSWIFNARSRSGELVAFDVAEFGAKHYSLYMFNFTSDALYVPGASDLLLSEMIQQAKTEKKKYINLGLGINPGVTFFKKKWGGVIFLPYAFCLYYPSRKENLERLLQKL